MSISELKETFQKLYINALPVPLLTEQIEIYVVYDYRCLASPHLRS